MLKASIITSMFSIPENIPYNFISLLVPLKFLVLKYNTRPDNIVTIKNITIIFDNSINSLNKNPILNYIPLSLRSKIHTKFEKELDKFLGKQARKLEAYSLYVC